MQLIQAHVEREREHGQQPVARRQAEPVDLGPGARREIAVADHHALLASGRAGREQTAGERVRSGRARRSGSAPAGRGEHGDFDRRRSAATRPARAPSRSPHASRRRSRSIGLRAARGARESRVRARAARAHRRPGLARPRSPRCPRSVARAVACSARQTVVPSRDRRASARSSRRIFRRAPAPAIDRGPGSRARLHDPARARAARCRTCCAGWTTAARSRARIRPAALRRGTPRMNHSRRVLSSRPERGAGGGVAPRSLA